MQVTASKLTTAPNDVNKVESQANQDAVTITKSGNNIVVSADLEALNSFASTNEAQGSGKWVGIDINTGLDSIVGATWNGYALTQDDVDEAASVGLGNGHIIFWTKADVIVNTPKTIVIGKEGYEDVTLTVSFEDTHQL